MSSILSTLTANLATSVGASDTSIQVRNLKDARGTAITTFPAGGTICYATIEPRSNTNQEAISFNGLTSNGNGIVTLTGVIRNLNPQYPFTPLTANVPHATNSELIISNSPSFYSGFLQADQNVIITGLFQFPSPTLPASPATKAYADSLTYFGAPDATATSKGIGKLSSSPIKSLGTVTVTIASPAVVSFTAHGLILNDTVRFTTSGNLPTGLAINTDYYVISAGLTANAFQLSATVGGSAINTSGTQSGVHTLYRSTPILIADNDPRLNPNNYGVDVGSTDDYAITLATAPTAYILGYMFFFKPNTINTGTATLNVNGLGAKTIVRADGTTLSDGDIVALSVVQVIYDGTNFRLLTTKNTVSDAQVFTSNGTWTKPNGAKVVEYFVIGAGGGGGSGNGFVALGGGGGGGGGGGYSTGRIHASILGATVSVTVGTGGTAGVNTNPGGNGGSSTFGVITSTGGVGGGTGGNNFGGGGGTGGTGLSYGTASNGTTGGGGTTGGAGTAGTANTTTLAPTGGGGGGGYNSGSGGTGGAGGAISGLITRAGGTGGAIGGAGGAGNSASANEPSGGTGGGGGGGVNGVGGVGGNGGTYGGGGGGGGGSNNGGSSGQSGGTGGGGIVVVITT